MVEIFGQFYNFYLQRTVQDAMRGLTDWTPGFRKGFGRMEKYASTFF